MISPCPAVCGSFAKRIGVLFVVALMPVVNVVVFDRNARAGDVAQAVRDGEAVLRGGIEQLARLQHDHVAATARVQVRVHHAAVIDPREVDGGFGQRGGVDAAADVGSTTYGGDGTVARHAGGPVCGRDLSDGRPLALVGADDRDPVELGVLAADLVDRQAAIGHRHVDRRRAKALGGGGHEPAITAAPSARTTWRESSLYWSPTETVTV